MIRRRAGLLETDDEPTTRARIAETVQTQVSDETERRWIEPALLALLGVDTGAAASDELFAAWRTFFERMAETSPVVMVFEDFHYADSGLIDFVDHLLEWSRSFPIYVLTLARPELIERRPAWGAGKRSFTSIFLEPLPDAAMHELLAGLVPGLPASAEQAIVTRADGMPLYAVETVRMLLSEGRLTVADGVYRPTGDLTNLAVPETLTALIASRLDALAPADRALVSDAAVLGQSFTPAGLAAVSGLDPDDLAARLRSLVGREILTLETDPRSPERGQYAFVQALIREVAYNALAKRDRKSRHLAAARFFESLDTDEIAGGLAGHYLAACRNATEGQEADAVGAQARIALTAAAQRAIGLGSFEQALTFFEQALSVTNDPAETGALLESAGDAASAAGRHEAAEAHLRRAIEAQRQLGDRPAIAGAIGALGRALLQAYRTNDAVALLEPAAVEFDDSTEEPEVIAVGGQLARAYFLTGSLDDRAIEVADRVLKAAEHADLAAIVADTLVTRGTALTNLGRPIEGLGAIVAGRELAEAHGLGATVLRASNNEAVTNWARDPQAALGSARAGLALARRLGARSWVSGLVSGIGDSSLRTGDWQTAVAELTAALAEEWEASDEVGLVCTACEFWALRGEPVDDRLAAARTLITDLDNPQIAAGVDIAEGYAALANGDLRRAGASWRRAASLVGSMRPLTLGQAARSALWAGDGAAARGDLVALDGSGFHGSAIEADRTTMRAGIAALEGRMADALSLYREALRAWRDLGLAWDEALCGLDMALLLDPAEPEVRAAVEASREILVRLEAAPFIARLDASLGRAPDATGQPEGLTGTAPVASPSA
jgi:tetratricopeptide (TPR) repeat protein